MSIKADSVGGVTYGNDPALRTPDRDAAAILITVTSTTIADPLKIIVDIWNEENWKITR
jgi:hypothetical protein